jgi:nucleoside-diphosphate-sugar epimerase
MRRISQFESDVNEIVERSYGDLQELLSHNIRVTGGGGFVGRWIVTALASFAEKIQKFNYNITSFSRSTPKRQEELLERELISVVNGGITAPLQIGTDYGHVFHCAAPASAIFNALDPAGMQKLIEAGARNLAAHFASTAIRVVNVSSGAVYGVQPTHLSYFTEEWVDAREHTLPDSAYHRGKSCAEVFLNETAGAGQLDVVHTRLFVFLAPHLPLDAHFAGRNFLKNAIDNRPTTIAGDGRNIRTYMYGTDLAVWIFAIAARCKTGRAYNVGSPRPISIANLAAQTATLSGSSHQPVDLGNTDLQQPPHCYLPCTNRVECEFGVTLDVDLTDATSRTLNWLREL